MGMLDLPSGLSINPFSIEVYMHSFIFVVDANGNPGHPTRKASWVRKVLKRKLGRLIGGGASKHPVVLRLNSQIFDYSRTVEKTFTIALDPGSKHIGYSVLMYYKGTITVLAYGQFDTRTLDISKLLYERKMYRRARRYYRRKNAIRKLGHSKVKFRQPRWKSRNKNKLAPSYQHGVLSHVNLANKLAKMLPLPSYQMHIAIEHNSFDIKRIRDRKEPNAIITASSNNGCVFCSSTTDLHRHHLNQRNANGSNRKANILMLCKTCHDDYHTGKLQIPDDFGSRAMFRDAAFTNVITGILRKQHPEYMQIDLAYRQSISRQYDLIKDHGTDAIAVGISAIYKLNRHKGINSNIELNMANRLQINMQQFRRHNRKHINANRDRHYKLNGAIIAHNRNKRTDQKDHQSLAEVRNSNPAIIGKLTVVPAIRAYKTKRNQALALGGDVFIHNATSTRFIADGIMNNNTLIYSKALMPIIGRNYISPNQATRIRCHSGIVVM